MPQYKLRGRFFDGTQLYRAGDIVEIEAGKAPRTAQLLGEVEAAPAVEPEPEPAPELDLGVAIAEAKPGDTLSSLGKAKK
jgi:hypothetical protein